MQYRYLIAFMFLFSFRQCIAGDSTCVFGLKVGVNRMDIFTGAELGMQMGNFSPYTSFTFGYNRTLSQKRFFPRLVVGITYDLLKEKHSLIGPDVQIAVSSLRVNKNVSTLHYWTEYLAGIRYMSGGRLKFVGSLSAGWVMEYLYSDLDKKYRGYGIWAYSVNLGIAYAF